MNETTNASGRKAANSVIGVLKNHQMPSEKSFLLSHMKMFSMHHTKIVHVFNEAMQTL
jgi:hypothetical protein